MPTALLCSDEFAPLARAESTANGSPGLPLIVVPHPLAGNLADLVNRKAEGVVEEIFRVLQHSTEELEAEYEGRFLRPAERRLSVEGVCNDAVCAVEVGRPR